jgi:hypothetical protein
MSLQERDVRTYFQHYFPNLRPRENGWAQTRCLFHEDRNPSLSINLKHGGWHCFAEGVSGGILEFEERRNGGGPQEAWKRVCDIIGRHLEAQLPESTVFYDYRDENGKLLYQVVRQPQKKFAQRQPDGKGGWTWNLRGVRRVPYRLPEVLKAEHVFITEGEKDADSLSSLGLVATTNSGGAGKWRSEFAAFFKGKHVVILPDNDAPGQEHAEKVAANLKPVALSVKVLALPGLAEHGDVSDWLAQARENTRTRLEGLITDAPLWEPSAGKQAGSPQPRIPSIAKAQETLPNGSIAEIVSSEKGTGTRFCIFTASSREVEFADQLENAGKLIKPAASEWAAGQALSLPTAPEFSELEPHKLFAAIYDYISKYFQGEESLVCLTVLYIMLTWRVHQISEVAYLRVLGEAGSGKSRWLSIAAQLCYRGVLPSVDFTESALFRLLKAVPDATFAIDEADRRTGLEDPLSQVLRAGMERHICVWRSDPKGEGQAHEPQPFPCFGPKLLAATRPFRDDALESRIISFSLPLQDVPEHIPVNAPPELDKDAAQLRNRLLAYRILNYGKTHEFRTSMQRAANELQREHLEGRTIQIGTGLLTIGFEVGLEHVTEICKEVLQEHSQGIGQGRRETLDGITLEVLHDLRQNGKSEIPLNDLCKLVCQQAQQRGVGRTNPDGTAKPITRPQGLSRMLRKQGKRFGVWMDSRLHGKDQPVVHFANK